MIPLVATIKTRSRSGRGHHFWIPLFLIWLLLLPIALLLTPLVLLFCLVTLINPLRLFGTLGAIFAGLRGTHIEVEEPNQFYLISIR